MGIKSIAIIGAGQIGSRHLQALAKIDFEAGLQVVDPIDRSLKIAEERFQDVPSNNRVVDIDFLLTMDGLRKDIDLCIIATSSDVRLKVLQEVVRKKNVKNIILEKVAFQSEGQFERARQLLDENNISCWVNCPRPIYPIYKELKSYLTDSKRLTFRVFGGNWGLACNAIHLIDLFSFFLNQFSYDIDISALDPCVWDTKREGYIEVTGRLSAYFPSGSRLEMVSIANSNEPVTMEINSDYFRIQVSEGGGAAFIDSIDGRQKQEMKGFTVPFQSNLTQLVAREILMTGRCGLTSFSVSYQLHKPLLDGIRRHIKKATGYAPECCPIT